MASATSPDESLGSVFAALAANMAIATANGTAAALTGSPALLAETLHTVADAGNEVLLYVPDRYVAALRARLEDEAEIHAVRRLEAVYLGPGEVLVAADVAMADGLTGEQVAAGLARTRADVGRELPVIARLYLTPVEPPSPAAEDQ